MTIYITGDKHGDFHDLKKDVKVRQTSSADILIILGDVGVNFFGDERDEKSKRELSSLGLPVLCVRGNHEMRLTDPALDGMYREIEWCGGKVYVEDKWPHLLFAQDGERYHIGDHDFLVIGGAYSVDKWYRLMHGYPWFADEQLTPEEMAAIREEIAEHGNHEDIILAHTCPYRKRPMERFIQGLDQNLIDSTMERFLQEIVDSVEYNRMYCSHWHTDKIDGRVHFLYNKVETLKPMEL